MLVVEPLRNPTTWSYVMPVRLGRERSTLIAIAVGAFPAIVLVSSLATSTVAEAAPTPSTVQLVSATPVTQPLAPEWNETPPVTAGTLTSTPPVTFAPKPTALPAQSTSRVVSKQSDACVKLDSQLAMITVRLRAGSSDAEADTADLNTIIDHLVTDCGWRIGTVNARMAAAR